jgi:hypothetical protein
MNPGSPHLRFAVSSRSTPLLGCDDLRRVADAAGVDGVDLDLTGSALRRRFAHVDRLPNPEGILSIWIPSASPSTLRSTGSLAPTGWTDHGGLVVVDEEGGATPNGKRQLGTAAWLRDAVPNSTRVALAVRPRNPEAGRAHLSRLSLLRNYAEEWDLDLALDLSGPMDWLWEAEAAVTRLASRLRLLRIIDPLPPLDSHTRSRLMQRTLAACADAGFGGLIAVVCPMPIWRWRAPEALHRSTRVAVERLGSRFGIVPAWPRVERTSSMFDRVEDR